MNKIKKFRAKHNLTQQQFCDKFGYNINTLRDYESGKTRTPEHLIKHMQNKVIQAGQFVDIVLTTSDYKCDTITTGEFIVTETGHNKLVLQSNGQFIIENFITKPIFGRHL